MMPSTSSNLHYPRRLLLETPFHHLTPTTPAPPPDYQQDSASPHGGFNANLVMVLSVLLCALICSLCVNTVIRCMMKCTRLITRDPNYNINTISHEVATNNGVDKRALRTFPIVKYSKEVKIQGLDTECVICLSEFGEGEKLRILPKCNHGFHVKCIDKWLSSNSSCPTCRQSLVDTCQKIIGCDDHQASSSSVGITGEIIVLTIVPLQREDLVRNYREQIAQS